MVPGKQTNRIDNATCNSVNLGFGYFDFTTLRLRRYSSVHPNLLLLGAQKCGTTSLAYYLSYHPDIHLSSPLKEAGFYLFDEWSKRYWRQHGRPFRNPEEMLRLGMLHGYSGQRYILDAATWYTMPAISGGLNMAERVKSKVGKGIYIVRHPLARIISAYKNFYEGKSGGFNAVLDSEPALVDNSLYFRQLQPFIAALGADGICVVSFEELIADIPGTLNRIVRFLGLEDILPLADYPAMNASRNNTRYLYSRANFERVRELILPDVARLESFAGRSFNWDFNPSAWLESR